MKVAMIHGGTSTEQAVSTLNATHISQALTALGHQVNSIFYDKEIVSKINEAKPDVAFVCVQGKYHGDGTLQAILDLLEIPYTGSRTKAAAIINDKIVCKKLFREASIPTPKSFYWKVSDAKKENAPAEFFNKVEKCGIKLPCIVKAPGQGGSFGLAVVESEADYKKVSIPFAYDDVVLVEQFVFGRFFTVGILEQDTGPVTFPVIEGIGDKKDGFISMNSEYSYKEADLTAMQLQNLQDIAMQVFETCEARGYARVDFIVEDGTDLPYVLEINAVPGLKKGSLFPMAAKLAGIEYHAVVDRILMDAFR
jgi:D-alanine-D-alanine ligase